MRDSHNLYNSLERPILCNIEPLDGRFLSIPICILKGSVGGDGRHCAGVKVLNDIVEAVAIVHLKSL